MYDPRWSDDGRDRDSGSRDLSRGSRGGSDSREREREIVEPREVFAEHVRLPREREREHVWVRDRCHMLRGSESRALASVGAFRVIPAGDLRDTHGKTLDPRHGELWHLREAGLVQTVRIDRDTTGITLTREGRELLEGHRRDQDAPDRQTFNDGIQRPRELKHDATVYRAYLEEADRLHEAGAEIHRIVLENELKAEYQAFLQEPNRDREDSDGRPDRSLLEIESWAHEHNLPCDEQGHLQFPDVRIEYELDGRDHTLDVEVMTPHYRGRTPPESRALGSISTFQAGAAVAGAAVAGRAASRRTSCDVRRTCSGPREERLHGAPGAVPDDPDAAHRRLRPAPVRALLRHRPRGEDTEVLRQARSPRLCLGARYAPQPRAHLPRESASALRGHRRGRQRLAPPAHAQPRHPTTDAARRHRRGPGPGVAGNRGAEGGAHHRADRHRLQRPATRDGRRRRGAHAALLPGSSAHRHSFGWSGRPCLRLRSAWHGSLPSLPGAACGRALRAWTLRIVVPPDFPGIGDRATKVVEHQLMSPLRSVTTDEMRWYFGQLRSASPGDLERFNRCRRAFSSPRSQVIYRLWKQDGEAALVSVGSPAIREAVEAGRGRIEVLELGHRYGHLSPLAAVS